MKTVGAIVAKELKTQFRSPMAYIVLFLCLGVFHLFFFVIIDQNQEATLRDVFRIMEFLFVFIIPLLTMKLIAEERFSGTMEFLKTSPVTNTAIILGKYLGALVFYTILIAATLVYALILAYFSKPDIAAMATGYLGIWLEGAFFIAIGLMTSSWTRNQILAAMTSYVLILSLYFSLTIVKFLPATAKKIVNYASCMNHLQNFAAGIISTADLVYFLSGIVFCLLLSRLSIEHRLWR